MRHRLLLFTFSIFSFLFLPAQRNQQKLDSLAASIARSHQATKHWQDSFIKAQDSIQRLQLKQVPPKAVVVKNEERNRIWLPLAGAAIVLFAFLFVRNRLIKKKRTT